MAESKFDLSNLDMTDTKILLVDDNEISIMILVEMLRNYNFSVDLAMNGKDAINLANKNSYDLIFMDYMMPELDGIQTTEQIRKGELNTDTPIIVLSGSTDDTDLARYFSAGMNDYLSKPIDTKELQSILFKWLPSINDIKKTQNDILIDGIDTSVGLENFGDNIFYYIEILRMFVKNSQDKIVEINEFLQKRNYNGYTVEIHGLKSEASIIGATELALLAKELEIAGKAVQGLIVTEIPIEQNLAFIEIETKSLIELYQFTVESIKSVIGIAEESEEEVLSYSQENNVSNEKLERAKRYILYAIESIQVGDNDVAINWLNEVLESCIDVI